MNKTLLLLAAAWLQSCAAAEPPTPAARLASVDYSDGISRSEADNIAEAYFATHVGCGSYSGISNSDNGWVVEGKFGFGGDPIKGFLINKKTGEVTSTVGPSYAHPNEMLKKAST